MYADQQTIMYLHSELHWLLVHLQVQLKVLILTIKTGVLEGPSQPLEVN